MVQWKTRFACAPRRDGKAIALAAIASMLLLGARELRAQAEKAAAPAAAPAVSKPAHQYLEMPIVPPTLRGWQRAMSGQGESLATHAKNVTRGDEPLEPPGGSSEFDKFFSNQLFPQFTIYTISENVKGSGQTSVLIEDPAENDKKLEHQSRLPIMRGVFISQFLTPCKDNKTVYDRLAGLAINSMREIALKDYHPLARYNAVQLLASISDSSGSKGPYPTAWKVFVDCLSTDSDLVKVAAMNAVLRNAKSGVPPDLQAALTDKLESILADKKVAKNETQEAHDWTRRKAIEVLLTMGDPASSAKVVADLAAILNDPQSSVELCCAAARALGTIRSAALSAVDLTSAVTNLGRAGVAAARGELDRAEFRAFLAPLPVQNGQGNNFGGRLAAAPAPDAADAAAEPPPVQTFINVGSLKGQLTDLITALKGPGGGLVAASAGGPAEQKAAAIQAGLTALLGTCDPKATDYAALKQQIEGAATALEANLGKSAPAASAPAAVGKGVPSGVDPLDSLDKAPVPAAKNAGGK